jgi:DNA-binding NtrC family response regulator
MGQQKKILLIENQRIIALDLKNILQKDNYLVLDIVYNSSLIFSYISTQKPDLIITSYKGNPNFSSLIKKISEDLNIPVIIITGVAESEIKELRCIKGCKFIFKPYKQEQLRNTAKEILLQTELNYLPKKL